MYRGQTTTSCATFSAAIEEPGPPAILVTQIITWLQKKTSLLSQELETLLSYNRPLENSHAGWSNRFGGPVLWSLSWSNVERPNRILSTTKVTWKLSRKYKLFACSVMKEDVKCLYVKAWYDTARQWFWLSDDHKWPVFPSGCQHQRDWSDAYLSRKQKETHPRSMISLDRIPCSSYPATSREHFLRGLFSGFFWSIFLTGWHQYFLSLIISDFPKIDRPFPGTSVKMTSLVTWINRCSSIPITVYFQALFKSWVS